MGSDAVNPSGGRMAARAGETGMASDAELEALIGAEAVEEIAYREEFIATGMAGRLAAQDDEAGAAALARCGRRAAADRGGHPRVP